MILWLLVFIVICFITLTFFKFDVEEWFMGGPILVPVLACLLTGPIAEEVSPRKTFSTDFPLVPWVAGTNDYVRITQKGTTPHTAVQISTASGIQTKELELNSYQRLQSSGHPILRVIVNEPELSWWQWFLFFPMRIESEYSYVLIV